MRWRRADRLGLGVEGAFYNKRLLHELANPEQPRPLCWPKSTICVGKGRVSAIAAAEPHKNAYMENHTPAARSKLIRRIIDSPVIG